MLEKCNIKEHKIIKLVVICIILTMLSYAFFGLIDVKNVYATQTREIYNMNKVANYPGYKELIQSLKKNHPTWHFVMLYTGLDWNQVIKNETSAYHGRNVVPSSWSSAYKCAVCGDTPHGGSSWRCASEAAVSYYMDPRNWLNDSYIFQFENLAYNEEVQTLDGVQKIVSDVRYMQGNNITYTKTDGTQGVINKSYAQVIMEAASEARISPYHLASRIRQEQGTGSSPSVLASGNCSGYIGYYNFLNIRASGSTNAQVIANGMAHAKKSGWTDPEISIKEGAKMLASNYINSGQDTLYLQKFDVDNSDGTLYYFQYMQNVAAAASESTKVKSAYESLGLLGNSLEFIIPVYENMPMDISPVPQNIGLVTQDVKVTGNNVTVRISPSANGTKIATLNKNDIILRIEQAPSKSENYYWDKVVLTDGRQGYIARDYIEQIADISNCNEQLFVTTSAYLRNGPGTYGTTVVATLTKGQAVTRTEKDKYNVDGYIWSRVKLPDGRKGYIAQNYIAESISVDTNTELIKVTCNSGLKIREFPGTDKKVLTYVYKNDILTRTEREVSNANGYIWDKIVTSSGIEGYIARGTSTESYIEVIPSNNETTTRSLTEFKLQDNSVICEPETKIENIKAKYSGKTVLVKDASGKEVTDGSIGTGYNITIDNTTYTAVKLGDVNGDSKITSADYVRIKNIILKKINPTQAQTSAANTNGDENVTSADYVRIKNYILKKVTIEL